MAVPPELAAWSPVPSFSDRLAAHFPYACVPKAEPPWVPTAEALPRLLGWPDSWEARLAGVHEHAGVSYLSVVWRDPARPDTEWGAGFAAAESAGPRAGSRPAAPAPRTAAPPLRPLVALLAALLAGCATSAPTVPTGRAGSAGGFPTLAVVAYADSLLALPPTALTGTDRAWLDVYREAAARETAGPAQAVTRPGLSIGPTAYFSGTTYVLGDSLFIEQGAGLGLRAGYDVTSEIAAFLSVGRARIYTADEAVGTIGLTAVDVGARIDPPGPPSAFNPYVQLALTLQTATADALATGPGAAPGETRRLTARGGGVSLGGGVLVAVAPRLALDLSADVTLGRLRALAPEGEAEPGCFCSRSARIGVGLVYRP